MKKVLNLSVILAVLVAAFSFSSCSDNEADISVKIDRAEWKELETITGSIASSNRVETIKIEYLDGNVWQPLETLQRKDFAEAGITEGSGNNLVIRLEGGFLKGQYTIQAIDNKGNESKKAPFTVKGDEVNPPAGTSLSQPADFTWQRTGTTGTGMSQFGLEMSTGGTSPNFVIRVTSATKLVNLTAGDWTDITTKEALKTKIDDTAAAANNRVEFPMTNADVNVVIGVIHGGNYYIFNVTKTETALVDAGTRNTVSGKYKN